MNMILLHNARAHLASMHLKHELPADVFREGARWMAGRLQELSPERNIVFDPEIPFRFYGCLKYGLSLAGMGIALWYVVPINLLWSPLSLLAFYVVEVHFLFLFPLLIEKHPAPWRESIRMTYRMGLLNTIVRVMGIAVFMLAGLFQVRKPLANWYVGCMAILLWYRIEKDRFP